MFCKSAAGAGAVLILFACAETRVAPKEPPAVAVRSASVATTPAKPVVQDTSPIELGPVVNVATLLDPHHPHGSRGDKAHNPS